MIGRRAVVGLSLLSALLFCAFAAQSASAAEKESTRTTAFTCVQDAVNKNGDFKDAHCDEKGTAGKEEFRHDLITGTTNIEGDNEKVTESTKKLESAILRGKIGLTATEITCEKFVTVGATSWIQNSEPELKNHKLTGTVENEFKKCEVKKPAKCTIREPIVSNATIRGVEGLKGPKAGEENAMGIRFKGELKGGEKEETFANILYQGAECALKNQEFPVTGSVIATSGPTTESGQSNAWGGTTLVFTPKFEMQKLHIGVEANKAEFETIGTPRMTFKTQVQNPISVTTLT